MKHVIVLTGLPCGLSGQQLDVLQRVIEKLLGISSCEYAKSIDFPVSSSSSTAIDHQRRRSTADGEDECKDSIEDLLASADSSSVDGVGSKGCAFITMHSASAARRAAEVLRCFYWPILEDKSMFTLLGDNTEYLK